MDETRVTTILAIGVLAYAARVLPQVLFVGKQFPEAWNRFLRYLSYSFICGIISNTLFVTGARFDSGAAPHRAVALALAIFVAYRTKSPVTGMIIGTTLVLLLSWFR
jgi:branched-subunit amino acid transport protein